MSRKKITKSIIGEIIGGTLKEIRGRKTQKDFANCIELNQSQYNLYETGKRIPPDDIILRVVEFEPNFRQKLFDLTIKAFVGLLPPNHRSFDETELVEYFAAKSPSILITEEEAAFIKILRETDPEGEFFQSFADTLNSFLEDALQPAEQKTILKEWNVLRRYIGLSEYKIRFIRKKHEAAWYLDDIRLIFGLLEVFMFSLLIPITYTHHR